MYSVFGDSVACYFCNMFNAATMKVRFDMFSKTRAILYLQNLIFVQLDAISDCCYYFFQTGTVWFLKYIHFTY